MPHVVLRTSSPLHELIAAVKPFVEREGETVWRLREVYLSASGHHALAECLLVSGGDPVRFFIQLNQREEDAAVVVRPYPAPRMEAVPSVKRMIALVAEAVREAHPDVEIDTSTIRDFLSDRYEYQSDPPPEAWDPLLPERGLPRPLDWPAVFGDDRPVEIEIGSGKGTFIVEAAGENPGANYLSIEWARPYARHIGDRVRRRQLANVRVVRADAGRFLEDHVAPATVRTLHIYFPDPWPKKRHHKRRLVSAGFARIAADTLEPGGEIRFATDHEEYFREADASFTAEARLEPVAPGDYLSDEDEAGLTNYERKYRAEGRPIFQARYRRVEASSIPPPLAKK